MPYWAKSKTGRLVEGAAWALEAGIGFGFISGATPARPGKRQNPPP